MRTVTAKTLFLLSGLIVACFAAACKEASTTGKVVVVGSPTFDFGRIRGANAPLRHEFRIRNETGARQTIESIRESCSCLDAFVDSEILDPGDETIAVVSIDPRFVFGQREATAFVVFKDATVGTLRLQTKAFVEPKYKVVVEPTFIYVRREAAPGSVQEVRLKLTEYCSHADDYERETRVSVHGSESSISTASPWKPHGWRFTGGYVRTSEVRLKYKIPADWRYDDTTTIVLRFRKGTEGGEELVPRQDETTLSIGRL